MTVRQLEYQREKLRNQEFHHMMLEPVMGTEAHTAWYVKLLDILDTLIAVENTLLLERKAQKVGA